MRLEHSQISANAIALEACWLDGVARSIKECAEMESESAAVLRVMARCLEQFEVTHGSEIRQKHPTSADTPKGLLCIATDGERADGRFAWVPGATNAVPESSLSPPAQRTGKCADTFRAYDNAQAG